MRLPKENRKSLLLIIIITLISGILEVFFIVSYNFVADFLWIYYFIICIIVVTNLLIVAYLVYRKKPELKLFILFFALLSIVSLVYDYIGIISGQFSDANYFFFPPKYDIPSHIFGGALLFTLGMLIFSLFEFERRSENIVLILVNVILFLYEIIEEIIEFFLGHIFVLLQNPFFPNSIQDILFNLIGSISIYLIFKKYLKKRILTVQKEIIHFI